MADYWTVHVDICRHAANWKSANLSDFPSVMLRCDAALRSGAGAGMGQMHAPGNLAESAEWGTSTTEGHWQLEARTRDSRHACCRSSAGRGWAPSRAQRARPGHGGQRPAGSPRGRAGPTGPAPTRPRPVLLSSRCPAQWRAAQRPRTSKQRRYGGLRRAYLAGAQWHARRILDPAHQGRRRLPTV